MTLPISLPFHKLSHRSNEEALRAVIFNVCDRVFAIPVGAVQKIVVCPPITNKIQQGIGLVNIDSQPVTIVDLGYQLNPNYSRSIDANNLDRFLILVRTQSQENCAIVTDSSPLLTDIPLANIQPVPPSYYQIMQLNFASHMALMPSLTPEKSQEQNSTNIFILGMEKILLSLT